MSGECPRYKQQEKKINVLARINPDYKVGTIAIANPY